MKIWILSERRIIINTYIFFTNSIYGIGGSKNYCATKAKVLKESGWNVQIFSVCTGELFINDLCEYEENVIPEIILPPFCYPQKVINRVINKIESKVQQSFQIIIESHEMGLAAWGEIVAEKLSAKSIIFLLSEQPENEGIVYHNFGLFKVKRKEVAGIDDYSVIRMLGLHEVSCNYMSKLRASYDIRAADVKTPFAEKLITADYTIGIFGRIYKNSVLAAIKGVETFLSSHKKLSFQVIFIGGGYNKEETEILEPIERLCDNLVITGNIFPVPRILLQACDVILASAGCASAASLEGIPTIAIDCDDNKAIGFLRYDTNNSTFRHGEEKKEIDVMIEKALFDKKILEGMRHLSLPVVSYDDHFKFIENSERNIEYYDWKQEKKRMKSRLSRIVYTFFFFFFGRKVISFLSGNMKQSK